MYLVSLSHKVCDTYVLESHSEFAQFYIVRILYKIFGVKAKACEDLEKGMRGPFVLISFFLAPPPHS
jgi:hypothetical protein